jgi:hypothetical protein
MNRRELLRGAAAGALGVGLLDVAQSAFGQQRACQLVLRLSKGLGAEIGQYRCTRCVCKHEGTALRIFRVGFEFKGHLTSYMICDETAKLIPNQSTLAGRLRIVLRATECPRSDKPNLVGWHDGSFELHAPKVGKIFTGSLSGTHGVDPRTSGGERCCWPYGDGVMRGKGIEAQEGCQIGASYLLKIPFDGADPCKTPPNELSAQLDGVLICPCKT